MNNGLQPTQDEVIERLIREADHQEIRVMLDYYLQNIGPYPPHIACIAAAWKPRNRPSEAPFKISPRK